MTKDDFDKAFRLELDALGLENFTFESAELEDYDEKAKEIVQFLAVRIDAPGDLHDAFRVKSGFLSDEMAKAMATSSKAAFLRAGQ